MFIRNYSFIRETRVGGVGKGEGPRQRTMEGSKTGREGKLFLKVNQEDRFGHFPIRNGLKLRFLLGSSRLRQTSNSDSDDRRSWKRRRSLSEDDGGFKDWQGR